MPKNRSRGFAPYPPTGDSVPWTPAGAPPQTPLASGGWWLPPPDPCPFSPAGQDLRLVTVAPDPHPQILSLGPPLVSISLKCDKNHKKAFRFLKFLPGRIPRTPVPALRAHAQDHLRFS